MTPGRAIAARPFWLTIPPLRPYASAGARLVHRLCTPVIPPNPPQKAR